MDEIKSVELTTGREKDRWISGRYITDEEEAVIKIEVLQNNEIKAVAAARVIGGKFGTRKPVQLERGLYQVRFSRCLNPQVKPFKFTEPIYYENLVMAGQKYAIQISVISAEMYDKRGSQVTVSSTDYAVKNHELYYMIKKADPPLKKIKFWVPMQEGKYLTFFVEGVSPDEIDFPKNQNGCLAIEVER